jgi:hypothetical protein
VSTANTFDVREYERFQLEPMYTGVTVQRVEGMALRAIEGHAYDVSEAGIRIELDEPLEVNERVAVTISLAGSAACIAASARVVWVHDAEDDPAARRMALEFTQFRSPDDHARLLGHLGTRLHRRCA